MATLNRNPARELVGASMIRQLRIDRLLLQRAKAKLPRGTFDLLYAEREDSRKLAMVIAGAAWIPTAFFAALNGSYSFQGFVADFAAQSRLLVVIPLLIVTEPWMINQWAHIAAQFLAANLISKEDAASFQEAFASFNRRRHYMIVQVFIVLVIYALAVAATPYMQQGDIPPWCAGTQVMGRLSIPGTCYLLVSLPFLLYLVLRWIWNLGLWSVFLYKVSRMRLQLVPSHPDQMGGLSFLETSLRSYRPFGFAVGTIAAGGVANKIVHSSQKITSFKSTAVFVAATVALICAGPLCTFYKALLDARRRGTFLYGALGIALGHHFEAKWVGAESKTTPEMLEAPDFSAAIDLFSVVGNVRVMKVVPFGVHSITPLVAVTLMPAVPLALAVIPFDVLLDRAIKLLL